MKKEPKEKPDKKNKEEEAEEKPKKPREKKVVEYEGSRWMSMWLLLATILACLLFSIAWR